MDYDLFISHASEDKEAFVRPLAEALRSRGLRVWIDEMELTLGDSLRRSIDYGLANSRYGIVVLSPDFLRKEWPKKELDGLVAREDGASKVILPIWHNVCREDIIMFSPPLADKLAAPSSKGLAYVVDQVVRSVGSTQSHRVLGPDSELGRCNALQFDDLILGMLDRIVETVDEGAEGLTDVSGVRTGLYDLDRAITGLQPGTLTLVAGRPSAGKSALVLHVAQHVGTVEGLPVILFAPKSSASQTVERIVCGLGDIFPEHLRNARLTEDEWPRLTVAIERLRNASISVLDKHSISLLGLKMETYRLAKLWGGLGAIVVDSVQDLSRKQGEYESAEVVCQELKKLARELNCPVLATCGLPRAIEARTDKRPCLSDLNESGDLNAHADVVLFVYRGVLYNPETTERDVLEVIVAKQRESNFTGAIKLALSRNGGIKDLRARQASAVDEP